MTWAAPWALAGLALLAVPTAIHLLGLGRASVRRFPSLRFIAASRLLPSRRTRIHDPLLLLVRLLAIAAAALALARPVPSAPAAVREAAGAARVVVVDTGAGMQRGGAAAADAARLADSVAREGAPVIRTADPAGMLAGAAAWLATRPGAGEIVVISDFGRGKLDSADLTHVPADVRLRLVRAGGAPRGDARATDELGTRFVQAGREVLVSARVTDGRTDATWTVGAPARPPGATVVVSGAADPSVAHAVERAADLLAVPYPDGQGSSVAAPAAPASPATSPVRSADTIAVVFGRREIRDSLLHVAGPLDDPWQGDVVARLAQGWRAPVDGGPLPVAAAIPVNGRTRLTVFADSAADAAAAAALVAAVRRAAIGAPSIAGLDPQPATDSALARLQAFADSRTATARPASAGSDAVRPRTPADSPAGARSLWAMALGLLGVEALVRRSVGARRGSPRAARVG